MNKILISLLLLTLVSCTKIPLTEAEKKERALRKLNSTEVVIVTNKITKETLTIEGVSYVAIINRSTFNDNAGVIRIRMSGSLDDYEFSEVIYAYMSMPYKAYQEMKDE